MLKFEQIGEQFFHDNYPVPRSLLEKLKELGVEFEITSLTVNGHFCYDYDNIFILAAVNVKHATDSFVVIAAETMLEHDASDIVLVGSTFAARRFFRTLEQAIEYVLKNNNIQQDVHKSDFELFINYFLSLKDSQ